MTGVTRVETRKMMKDNLLPAIRQKWPDSSEEIIIQQDNATPHITEDDSSLSTELTKDGFTMTLQNQPANSPDYNALDLGFFNSIQSIQHKKGCTNIDELVQAVIEAFWEQSPETIEDTFVTLQKCMESSMIAGGSNKYKLPHMGKQKMRRSGRFPEDITVDEDVIHSAMEILRE